MTPTVLTVANLVLAGLATLVALGGATHSAGRPAWRLNRRGWIAAACLAAALACGAGAEVRQARERDRADARIVALAGSLDAARREVIEVTARNGRLLGEVTGLQRDLEVATARIADELSDRDVAIALDARGGDLVLLQDRRRQDVAVEVDERILLTVTGTARDGRRAYPLFANQEFRIDWDGLTTRHTPTLPLHLYGVPLDGLRRALAAVEEASEASAAARWGPGHTVDISVRAEICAAVGVRHAGGAWQVFLAIQASPAAGSGAEVGGGAHGRCAARADAIPPERVFAHAYGHGLYFAEDAAAFLRTRLLSHADVERLGLPVATSVAEGAGE